MNRLTRSALIAGGTLSVALGAVGIFMPVLPTTPFLLLAAVCYARSSDRLYRWLLNNRWFGESIRNYREGRGLPLRLKILTILTLWLTIGISAFFAVSSLWCRIVLFLIMGGVTLHL
ncbi:MAG: YbaN family protein, partial [Candidatus Aminicenantes bacterium]|nr:YbaN family protein [Candidatus Aminicenantes bacterium]